MLSAGLLDKNPRSVPSCNSHQAIRKAASNDTGLLNFRFERVTNSFIQALNVQISSSARDNAHREGFSNAVCGCQ
jgi:hypothetical protein